MGIFDTFKSEVKREFIARPDESKSQIIYKWPDRNIRMLSQLTVQPDEVAVFVRDGQVKLTLPSGTHTLDGKSIPLLSALIDSATGGNFLLSELYFVSTREFTNNPFGGMIDNVIDPTTKLAITIRLFGEYSLKIVDPSNLILNLVGTKNITSNDEISMWVKELLMKVARQVISNQVSVENKPVLGIAARSSEIEQAILTGLTNELPSYGVEIPRLGNFTVSIKEEDEVTLKQMTRDFAYANNMAAADVAVKLGMAQGLQNPNSNASIGATAAAAGIGFGVGQGVINQQPSQPTQPVQPNNQQ